MEAPHDIYLTADAALGCDAWQWPQVVDQDDAEQASATRYVRADLALKVKQEADERLDEFVNIASQSVDDLRHQLAAAEAAVAEAAGRAERAEYERDQWMQEARAHAQRAAVVTQDVTAPYCDGKCGICYCQPSL
jgi:hypothetical protein